MNLNAPWSTPASTAIDSVLSNTTAIGLLMRWVLKSHVVAFAFAFTAGAARCTWASEVDISAASAFAQSGIDSYTAALESSDRAYRIEQFSQAARFFRQAIESSLGSDPSSTLSSTTGSALSAAMFINLGNAALQSEDLGQAIVAYRKALLLDPSDKTAQQNLDYARTLLSTGTPSVGNQAWSDWMNVLVEYATPSRIHLIAASCLLVAVSLMSLALFANIPGLRFAGLLAGCLWILFLGAALWIGSIPRVTEAVVIGPGAILRTADSENAVAKSQTPLPIGTEVVVLQSRDRWSEVSGSGQAGWLKSSSLDILEIP